MRLNSILGVAAFAVLFAETATAADPSGKWVADVLTRMGGSQMTTFNFKVNGAKLTGSISVRMGEAEITDGKIVGDELTFAVIEKTQNRETKTVYKGTVVGKEIRFESQLMMPPGGMGGFIPGPPTEFTAKRR
jgi:hypothetical protein